MIPQRTLWPALSVAAFTATALLAAAPARAGTFALDPVSISLTGAHTSANVAVTNRSPHTLRLQVAGYAWQQTPSGELKLTHSDRLVFFPQMLTLDPGQTQRVRVGIAAASAGPVEQSYRIFFSELPSLAAVTAPPGHVSVTILMKVGIPVFLSPDVRPAASGAVRNAVVRNGILSFDVVNTGNVHFSLQRVAVTGKNARGGSVLETNVPGWYLLAGETRHFTLPLGKSQCLALRSVAVDARTDRGTFTNSFGDLGEQCKAVSQRSRK